MSSLLGFSILSLVISLALFVPFIDFLYKIKLQRKNQKTKDLFDKPTPVFDKHHAWKTGTPFGGGILIVIIVSTLTILAYGIVNAEINLWQTFVILFSLIGYGLLGFYDDIKKLSAQGESKFFGLRFRHKFVIQWLLAFIIGSIFYFKLGYSFIYIQGFGAVTIGLLFIPLAAFIIVSFVNAFNIADGLDGLASGLCLICLAAFLAINASNIDRSLGIFIAILLGTLSAFLYFNIYKARLWLGDVGSLSLGASLAIIGLLTGKISALALIGGVFVIEIGSSLIQILGKKYLKRRIFPAAPFHLYLQKRGWEEPKIVMRAWLFGAFFAILGLYIAFLN